MERLQKVIAQAGITSRRKAEELILAGKVTVNGQIVRELGIKVNPEHDEIKVNNNKINIDEEKIVVLFNKPINVVTTMDDPQGRKKVIDFINLKQRVYPVGRLDYATEGLLLLTNDGELANRLMHPRYELDKTYEAVLDGTPSEKELNILRNGVKLEVGQTSPAEITLIAKNHKGQAKLLVTIHEGRNRQIRRMFEYINYKVIHLKRIKYGFLTLNKLPKGGYRILSKEEVCKLKKIVGINCD